MFVFQNGMGLQIGKNCCEQFFQYANDNSQELATVQTVGDAPIHALLDVCLDFHIFHIDRRERALQAAILTEPSSLK